MNIAYPLKNVLKSHLASSSAMLAVNVQNIQQIEIVSKISAELQTEVIIQFSAKYIYYFEKLIGIDRILDKYQSNKHLYFHLDHCLDKTLITNCINWGFDSVMYDGSAFSIKENILNTKEIVALANSKGVLVEGEVGIVGGVEDGFGGGGSTIFNLDDALSFYNESGVDLLALGIGNAHGVYVTNETVDINLLSKFQERLEIKSCLVLHGATGLDDDQILNAIKFGVVKVNFSTELKLVYQEIIVALGDRTLHDEIYLYERLSERLRPALTSIIGKMDTKCI